MLWDTVNKRAVRILLECILLVSRIKKFERFVPRCTMSWRNLISETCCQDAGCFITACQRSCGKVMFSQVSVCPRDEGGGVCLLVQEGVPLGSGGVHTQTHTAWTHPHPWTHTHRWTHLRPGYTSPWPTPVWTHTHTPGHTHSGHPGLQAGCTHPTGMLSCLKCNRLFQGPSRTARGTTGQTTEVFQSGSEGASNLNNLNLVEMVTITFNTFMAYSDRTYAGLIQCQS